jgi:hypothetical protein
MSAHHRIAGVVLVGLLVGVVFSGCCNVNGGFCKNFDKYQGSEICDNPELPKEANTKKSGVAYFETSFCFYTEGVHGAAGIHQGTFAKCLDQVTIINTLFCKNGDSYLIHLLETSLVELKFNLEELAKATKISLKMVTPAFADENKSIGEQNNRLPAQLPECREGQNCCTTYI